jgi:hypothetical protein
LRLIGVWPPGITSECLFLLFWVVTPSYIGDVVRLLPRTGNVWVVGEVLRDDVDVCVRAWGPCWMSLEITEGELLLEEHAHLTFHLITDLTNGITRGNVLNGG